MFEDFDYKQALKGGGKLIKGVVKAVSPDAGAGVDEAGGGLGDILSAAGVQLTDEEAQPAAAPTPQPTPKKSNARRFDEFGIAPRTPAAPERLPGGGWREVQTFMTPEGNSAGQARAPARAPARADRPRDHRRAAEGTGLVCRRHRQDPRRATITGARAASQRSRRDASQRERRRHRGQYRHCERCGTGKAGTGGTGKANQVTRRIS